MGLAQTASIRLLAAFQVSSCRFVSLLCLPRARFRRGPVLVLQLIKLFQHQQVYFLMLDKFENNFLILLKAASAPEPSGNGEKVI